MNKLKIEKKKDTKSFLSFIDVSYRTTENTYTFSFRPRSRITNNELRLLSVRTEPDTVIAVLWSAAQKSRVGTTVDKETLSLQLSPPLVQGCLEFLFVDNVEHTTQVVPSSVGSWSSLES